MSLLVEIKNDLRDTVEFTHQHTKVISYHFTEK